MGADHGEMGRVHEECVSKNVSLSSASWLICVNSVEGLAEMTAIGLGLTKEVFVDAGKYG